MARLIWTNKALDHLEGVVRHIEKDAPITALRFAQKIFRCVERLESHPESGSWIEEDDRRIYRQVVQGAYRVIYRVEGDVVYLVAVHHAARLLDVDDLS